MSPRRDLASLLRELPAPGPPADLLASLLAEAPSRVAPPRAAEGSPLTPLAVAASLLLLLGAGTILVAQHGASKVELARTSPAAIPPLVEETPSADALPTALPGAPATPDYAPRGRRDPYAIPEAAPRPRRPAARTPELQQLALHATVLLPKDRYAVFLDREDRCHLLREGDPVANGVLRAIDGDRVVFVAASAPQGQVVMGFPAS